MALVSLQNIAIGFSENLFDEINLQIEEGEKICLLGRNGSGKTTLMKIISGELVPDRGRIIKRQGAMTVRLTQEIPQRVNLTVRELVAGGQKHSSDWSAQHHLDRMLQDLKLPGESQFDTLSCGLKRRALLAASLLSEPDLLMLDEPTNHLDIESIAWLDGFLRSYPKALLLVTHDRQLVRSVAERIIEIDLGRLLDWKCDYESFQKRKEDVIAADEQQNRRFDKKLSQEELWIRQGIKARRTRNEGRVKALLAMREERRKRREAPGQVKMVLQEGKRSGDIVLRAKGLCFQYNDDELISNFSTTINRRDRIGIMGPNGCGKSTLIRLLLGEQKPDKGEIKHGNGIEIIYYDQQRQQLNEELTVWENIAGGNDHVFINGNAQHVVGYLQRFLFSPERMRVPVASLSGGERGRLLLARLFTQACNLMVLDEPTNDLDIETLELLEELLLEFKGTLLLISHDRTFINNVVTSTIVFEGSFGINEYIGGYDDWLRQRPKPAVDQENKKVLVQKKEKTVNKLTNKEDRLLTSLPDCIEKMEMEKTAIIDLMSQADFYRKSSDEIQAANNRVTLLSEEIAKAYGQWQELEDKRLSFLKS